MFLISSNAKKTAAIFLIFFSSCLASDNNDEKGWLALLKQKMESVSDWINEVSFADMLGFDPVSPENEAFIRSILDKAGVQKKVIIRRMSKKAKALFTRTNAFVIQHYLFVSEEWLNELPLAEKEFLISHEIIHLKEMHSERIAQAGLLFIYPAFVCLAKFGAEDQFETAQFRRKIENALGVGETKGFEITSKQSFKHFLAYMAYAAAVQSFVIPIIRRYFEKRADTEAAKLLGDAKGGVALMKRFREEFEDPQSKFAIRRFFAGISRFFASHPPLVEREAYLQELADQQEQAAEIA
jgi:Zn-dependent protease with chaperone function